jgi:hypothetical protein
LDVSSNTELRELFCSSNLLSTEALNNLFGTLHDNTIVIRGRVADKNIYIGNNSGTNVCNPSIAEERGWRVTYL